VLKTDKNIEHQIKRRYLCTWPLIITLRTTRAIEILLITYFR